MDIIIPLNTGMSKVHRLLVGLSLCSALSASAQNSWNASTLPLDGAVTGSFQTSTGWGYAISNPSAGWLVMTGIAVSGFVYAVPSLVFDFPIIKPFSSIDRLFDGSSGLYSVSWAAGVYAGSVDLGFFTLTAEWWSGDPFSGGSYIAAADSVLLPYSASVSGVPELPSAMFLLLGLAVAPALRQRQVKAGAAPALLG